MKNLALGLLLILIFTACKNPAQKSLDNNQQNLKQKTVVLVHGYTTDSRDMRSLAQYLEIEGYGVQKVDLPLTFDEVEEAAKVFDKEIERILKDIPDDQTIAMVGHSTGGLVIRYYLSHSAHYDRVEHVVLIATPNRGSRLAEIAGDISDLLVETFATLNSLRPDNIGKLGLNDPEETKIGAIAGNKGNLVLGQLLESENDGRVEVDSVYYSGLDDFIVVPHNHHEIHHKKETADLVVRFIETGSFKSGE
jgi:pimeloyl-ACP methyl ester carboxylesterase